MASSASGGRVKAEAGIKPDPDAAGAAASPALSEDDIYEDAGDLEFYDANSKEVNADKTYLTHVPKYLYDAWQNLDDNAEIKVGTVRTWRVKNSKGEMENRIAMLLDHKIAAHQSVPKEYNLDVKDGFLKNTFLFTEQDLPGFKNKSQGANSSIPHHLRKRQEPQRDNNNNNSNNNKPDGPGGRKGRFQPYYRKAIPKKTVLAGRFAHELNCNPVMNDETKYIISQRNNDALKPKATTKMMAGRGPKGIIEAGSHAPEKFGNFVRAAAPEAKKAKKQKEERAARLTQSELRDKIFQCFDMHKYWSMKAFKQQLNQPEAYLRENLEELANLNKSGRFANHWELKSEYKRNSTAGDEAPGTAAEAADTDSDGDEEMEDVMPA